MPALRHLLCLLAVSAGCGSSDSGQEWEPGAPPVVVVQFNVAGGMALADDAAAAENIAQLVRERMPDFVAVQECEPCGPFLERLGLSYELSEAPRAGTAIAYRSDRWELRDTNVLLLGEDDDGWGQRFSLGAELRDLTGTRSLHVYSTHWCVSVRATDDRCDAQRHVEYAEKLVAELPNSPVVVAGDLNVFDGFEDSPAVDYLLNNEQQPLTDVYRAVMPNGDAATFQGNSFAPAGRIDYLFANRPMNISRAEIAWAAEPGSDHAAVIGEIGF